jgi:hypothetical protein
LDSWHVMSRIGVHALTLMGKLMHGQATQKTTSIRADSSYPRLESGKGFVPNRGISKLTARARRRLQAAVGAEAPKRIDAAIVPALPSARVARRAIPGHRPLHQEPAPDEPRVVAQRP